MVCKNEALDVVKTVTHKRGFESCRKLSKEYGATNGTSLHEYTNLLEYNPGQNKYSYKSYLNSKTIDPHQITNITDLINSKTINPHGITDVTPACGGVST